jgi:hypothetical protein
LIQKTRHLDSIVARALLVADFIDSIGQKLTFQRQRVFVRLVPATDISQNVDRGGAPILPLTLIAIHRARYLLA